MAVVLANDGETWTNGGAYRALNDTWNKGSLVNGRDFTQTITIEPSTFPNGVLLQWNWPNQSNGSIYGYPEISWSVGQTAIKISDIASLTSNYNFKTTGNGANFDVAFEAWLYSAPGGVWETVVSEVMLWVHSNGWRPDFTQTFNDGNLNADVFIDPNWGDIGGGSNHGWQYVAAINKADKLSGSISFSNLLKDLMWKGVLTGREFMDSVEVGAEPERGSGSMKIDNLAYSLTMKTPVAGTAGNDNIQAQRVGQNSIDGGAGTDTVVYQGASSAYEFKAGASGVMVRAKNDLSTLDVLANVEKLRFDDLIYDAATGVTTPTTAAGQGAAQPGTPATPSNPVGGAFGLGTGGTAWAAMAYDNILRIGDGVSAPVGSDIAFDGLRIETGQASKAQILAELIREADATTTVATLNYQFFTGKIPSAGGLDYLVAPNGGNSANLNSTYYQAFSLENRYINFAVNLGKNGEGRASFEAQYGSKTLLETVKGAYATIFGSTPSDAKVADLVNPRIAYFTSYGQDGQNGIGTKAAAVGWLLAEAAKADVGSYSRANDAFLTDLADGAAFSIDLIGTYGRADYALVA